MKRTSIFLLLILFFSESGTLLAQAVQGQGEKRGDIRSTKHNLSRKSALKPVDSREVCVYCHTPNARAEDGERLSAEAPVPVWQKGIQSGHEFAVYDDIGRGEGVGSQSMACLSCHDATQAFSVGGEGAGDHPFGVPYRGARLNGVDLAAVQKSIDEFPHQQARLLKNDEDFREVRQAVINSKVVWWVPSSQGGGLARTRQDLPLYNRMTDNAADVGVPFIECGSCHDPHSSASLFLRVPNQESRLCLTCHDK